MTARVPIPEIVTSETPAISVPATVRLRPVAKPPTSQVKDDAPKPAPAQPEASRAADAAGGIAPGVPPLTPVHPPAPGSHPLPSGPKPPSSAQAQASKSKTSRISLDSAIGLAPMSPMSADKAEPKTIRLKRPADLAAPTPKPKVSTAPIRQTSRIPDSVLPSPEAAPAADETTSVTQKKTLKIKRPGAAKEEGAAEGGESFPEGVTLTPLSPLDLGQPDKGVFTKIALVAAVLALMTMSVLVYSLLAHGMGPDNGPNSLASVRGPKLTWPNMID